MPKKFLSDKYQFEVIFDSIHMRSTTTKIIVDYVSICDDFKEAWNNALDEAFKHALPEDYELVTIHYKGVSQC